MRQEMARFNRSRTFSGDTIVADAIKADPRVVDRLIALSPKFRRLRNPVLRRTMARLATIADAARIAGLPVERVLSAANGTAPPCTDNAVSAPATPAAPAVEAEPDWLRVVDEANAARIDVRPMLEAGRDPLRDIMGAARRVADGGTLIVDAPFDPAPLRRVLAKKGFVSFAREIAAGHFRVYFLRDRGLVAKTAHHPADDEAEASVWTEQRETHIDVRGLEPPQPMLAILKLLETVGPAATVIVHHEREPVFLFPELAERGWQWSTEAGDPGEVRLKLEHPAP
jgi:uncharacterized protein (DUF2249 family)